MYIYIAKFKNHKDAFKIGKANNIIQRLRKLSKTHGEVVYLRYIECKNEAISLNIEAVIHNTFNKKESLGYKFENDPYDPHVIEGEGSYEFFIADSVIDRLDFIESYIADFGFSMQCAKIENNKLIDITLEELYGLELEYYTWYVENIHWGEIFSKEHENYKIDKNVSERLKNDPEIRSKCILDYIRIEKEMRDVYSQKIEFADKYMIEKANLFELAKKFQFANNYYNFLSLKDLAKEDPCQIKKIMNLLNVEEKILDKVKTDGFKFMKSANEDNKVIIALHEEYSKKIS